MMFRKRLDDIQAQTAAEKVWWEKRRESIQKEFMKELDTPVGASSATSGSKNVSDEDTVLVEGGGPEASTTGSIRKKKGKK